MTEKPRWKIEEILSNGGVFSLDTTKYPYYTVAEFAEIAKQHGGTLIIDDKGLEATHHLEEIAKAGGNSVVFTDNGKLQNYAVEDAIKHGVRVDVDSSRPRYLREHDI